MTVTRRDFLKDIAFAAALVGLPSWVTELDEPPPMDMLSATSNAYPWPWHAPQDLGVGSPVVTLLNRIAFGARPGEFERVQAMGIDAFVEEQLYPETIDDTAFEQDLLSQFPTLSLSIGDLMHEYPQRPKIQVPKSKAERVEQLLGELGLSAIPRGPNDV